MSAVEKLASGAVPDYRPLQRGELIRRGDEMLVVPTRRGCRMPARAWWTPVRHLFNEPYTGHGIRIRRPIAPVTGRDLCE